jgi:hypothetical protein
LLPYVECDSRSPVAETARCNAAGVRRYPTWIIRNQRFEGVQTLETLGQASGLVVE